VIRYCLTLAMLLAARDTLTVAGKFESFIVGLSTYLRPIFFFSEEGWEGGLEDLTASSKGRRRRPIVQELMQASGLT
jgi:hypothetical protein